MIGLVDTSVFVATETEHLDFMSLPHEVAVSVVTVAELELGVLLAADVDTRQKRLSTLHFATGLTPIPIDRDVGIEWARIVAKLRQSQLRAPVNDIWIAATALSNSMSVITRDSDFDPIDGLDVIKV